MEHAAFAGTGNALALKPRGGASFKRRLAVYLPNLRGGGVERMRLNLAPALEARGFEVAFVLDRAEGELLDAVPASVEVTVLGAPRTLAAAPRLVAYLRRERPDVLLSGLGHNNVVALAAGRLSGASTRIVVSQHNYLSREARAFNDPRYRVLPLLYRLALPSADGVIAVSQGVADDMAAATGLKRSRINVIHNPVVTADLAARAAAPVEHALAKAWLDDGARPVLVAAGRLVAQKDYPTLLRAFARLRAARACRLLILGDGPLLGELRALAGALGVEDDVLFAGFVANPHPCIKRAAVLVLASRYEGFGNVLVEALAAGTPVVSTDCPAGPAEILEGGRLGRLVPVGDAGALADAVAATLDRPPDRGHLSSAAKRFSAAAIADAYAAHLNAVLDGVRAEEAVARV